MDSHHSSDSSALAADLFPPAEWSLFRKSDTQAATAIVVLMLGIFVVGIVLYSIVLATL